MKAVILAGGLGTRISEETVIKPKPMIEIGGKPILWHIMKIYSAYGVNEFIICLGYKGYVIKEYFANYFLHTSDVTFNMAKNEMQIHQNSAEPWQVTLVDTGEHTMTGGRLKRIISYVGNEDFFFTYGDGVANVNINDLYQFHKQQNTYGTVLATQPPGRFGALGMCENKQKVVSFKEKPTGDDGYINGGFFVLSPKVVDYIEGDHSILERDVLSHLATNNQLSAYLHSGFWQPMDTMREKVHLEELWSTGNAPWKVW